eukprot:scaffold16812_cov36-Phaeocystis_antarctica.AAC.1
MRLREEDKAARAASHQSGRPRANTSPSPWGLTSTWFYARAPASHFGHRRSESRARLSSRAGRYWSRRESCGSPPPGTQRTIDTALESSRWGERSLVETKCSFEVVRGATRIRFQISAPNGHAG